MNNNLFIKILISFICIYYYFNIFAILISNTKIMQYEKLEKMEKINSAMSILQNAVNDFISVTPESKSVPKFEEDRLTKTEAAKFVGVSMPTFDKMVKAGKLKQYNIVGQKLFLRSEIIEALKSND